MQSPLILACSVGQTEVVDILLAHGADVNICVESEEGFRFTALYHACQLGNIDLAEVLILNGADLSRNVSSFPQSQYCFNLHLRTKNFV